LKVLNTAGEGHGCFISLLQLLITHKVEWFLWKKWW